MRLAPADAGAACDDIGRLARRPLGSGSALLAVLHGLGFVGGLALHAPCRCPWPRTSSRPGSCRPWTGRRTNACPTGWRSRSGRPWRCRSTFPCSCPSLGICAAAWPTRPSASTEARADETMSGGSCQWFLGWVGWGVGTAGRSSCHRSALGRNAYTAAQISRQQPMPDFALPSRPCARSCCALRAPSCATTPGPRTPSRGRAGGAGQAAGLCRAVAVEDLAGRHPQAQADRPDPPPQPRGHGHHADDDERHRRRCCSTTTATGARRRAEWGDPEARLRPARSSSRCSRLCVEQLPGVQGRVFMMREWLELDGRRDLQGIGDHHDQPVGAAAPSPIAPARLPAEALVRPRSAGA